MNKRIFELAKQPTSDNLEFVGVELVTSSDFHSFSVWRGIGYHTHGAQCSPQELLSSWRDHLAQTGAIWLVPLLERFSNGEPFDIEVVLNAYQQHHGHSAPSRVIE
jgi:hypothetical protein